MKEGYCFVVFVVIVIVVVAAFVAFVTFVFVVVVVVVVDLKFAILSRCAWPCASAPFLFLLTCSCSVIAF
jgi:hypothetical protein